MTLKHLASAIASLLVVAWSSLGGLIYAQGEEASYIHAMASRVTDQMTIGEAWQRAAFRQPDLLVIYGSSELLQQPGPYQAMRFFHTYPTGFETVEIARSGINSLNLAQDLAAVGPDLRGKNVVISFTPTVFLPIVAGQSTYDGNFSQLHADEFIFSSLLGWDLKQVTAKRMLQYPKTLVKDPILHFALDRLVGNSFWDHLLYSAALPLGELEIFVLRLEDHWNVLNFIWTNPKLTTAVSRKPETPDWTSLAVRAEAQYKLESNNNTYGIENKIWTTKISPIVANGPSKTSEKDFVTHIQTSQEWGDLEILLQTLNELGAEPLLLSRPFNGMFWDTQGVSAQDRMIYYDKLESIAARYKVAVVDYRDHDEDQYFSIDSSSHTSPKGWIYVDQTLDEFFHGTLH